MKHFIRHNFPGLRFALTMGLLCLIGLTTLLPLNNARSRRFSTVCVCLSGNATPETADILRQNLYASELEGCKRFLGLHGYDLLWGYDPKPQSVDDFRVPYGLLVVPMLVFGFSLIAYVAWRRCRKMFNYPSTEEFLKEDSTS
ncbi:MAG TPA: hypothetical protein PLN21_11925 [Gemmatales bacterium]|nr:hypothetical protein [Gemmatales bacterium]